MDDITSTSEQEIRSLTKNGKLENGVSNISLTVSEKSITNQDKNNQEKISCHVHKNVKNKKDKKIENLFHELGINFTDTNEASCLLILDKFEGNKVFLEKYLINIHNQLKKLTNIKNLPALFSKKLKDIDYSLISKIKSEGKNELKKIQKEKEIIINEERIKEKNEKQNQFVNEFLKLDKSIQENIVDLAEQNYLKENSTINIEMLKVIKKNTYRTYLKMIYFKLLEIIKKNNLKVGDAL